MATEQHRVLKLADLPADGQMKQVDVAGRKLLLANVAGRIHALTGTCPHYGAPLAEGTLRGSRLRCPWHQGCFDVTTGDLLQPPPLVSLQRYSVRVEGDDVIVTVPATADEPLRDPVAIKSDAATDPRRFVIIGAGAASEMAAQTLREAGFRGQIQMLGSEPRLPYDRPTLSKNYLAGQPLDHPLPLQPQTFYERHGIERISDSATGVSIDDRTLRLVSGATITFDALLVAPGAVPRRLGVPGEELRNVFTLRSLADCDAILAAAAGASKAVLVGTGFIGMEAASCLRQRGLEVTVIGRDAVPFRRVLGEPLGQMFLDLHQRNGVQFHLNAAVERFEGTGNVSAVVLRGGERIPADLVIVALGVRPATDFLRGVIPLNDDGSITVDRSMRLPGTAANVYAAGDVARFPSAQTGDPIRVEHWRVAQQLGRIAAFNMAGRPTTYDEAPYFWSFQFSLGLDYVGHGEGWDRIHVDGDTSADHPDFLAYYIRLDEVLAVAGCNRSRETNAIAELMRAGRMPTASEVRTQPINWLERLSEVPNS
jgi:NADPH-dependent 2,4-dienoyl-CoA reductase/sulfur reductase-like enzyme/nitrite reductase/ring-hydroxylating ferredoxin subunit